MGYTAARNRKVSTKFLGYDPMVRKHPQVMRFLWRTHVQGCLKRRLDNLITIDEYETFTKKCCHYCGMPPLNKTKYKHYANMKYNGIDRIDNALPYVLGNLVPCCKLCNAMKSSLSEASFLIHILTIASHTVGSAALAACATLNQPIAEAR